MMENQEHDNEKAQRSTEKKIGGFEVKIEGLADGYRFTVKADEEKLKNQRRVGGAFINVLMQAEKAGWNLPWLLRKILKFWRKYK
jgi:hypothetical protein